MVTNMSSGRIMLRLLVFPFVVACLFVGLVVANVNGSSVAELSPNPAAAPSVIVGQSRAIRSDEWLISTPLAVGETRDGFPANPYVGLTPTNLAASAYGGPSGGWTETFKPQNWGYFLLGPSRGLAFDWWFALGASLIGLFALVRLLTGRESTAVVLAIVGTFTPYVAWWSCTPAQFVGFAAGAGACAIAATRTSRRTTALLLTTAGAYLLVAFALGLYPPWIVSLGWVVVAVVVGQVIDLWIGWRKVTSVGVAMVGLAAAVLALWYVSNEQAVTATANTYYPGNRSSGGGGATLSLLFDAPANFWLSQSGVVLGDETNLSEVSSSWLPLPIVLVAVLTALWAAWPRRADAVRPVAGQPAVRWSLVTTSIATVLLIVWALFPIPAAIGRLLLLDKAEGSRLPLAIGFGVLLLVAMTASVLKGRRPPAWLVAAWVLAVMATIALSVWAASTIPWITGAAPPVALALSAAVLAITFALVAAGRCVVVAGSILAAYCFVSWAVVNPLNHGLGPLTDDPLVVATRKTLSEEPGAQTASFGDMRIAGLLQAAGAQPRSFVTFYPDPAIMNMIAPGQEQQWNNYANWIWVPSRSARSAFIVSHGLTIKELHIDPCGREIRSLGLDWIVAENQMFYYCLKPVDVIDRLGAKAYRYRVVYP